MVAFALLVVLLLVPAFIASVPGGNPSGSAATVPSAGGPSLPVAAPALPTPIRHVITIMMENEGVDQIYGKVPYETQLANKYAWGGDPFTSSPSTGYYAVCHPSAPNYLALTAGEPLQCGTDAYNTYSANNVAYVMDSKNVSWLAYMESASSNCQTSNSGAYVVHHDPFAYFTDISNVCAKHVLATPNLIKDFPYASVPPAYTWITPNYTDDGHRTSASYGDTWLSQFVPKLMAQPWFASTVIFVVWDESYGQSPNSGYSGLVGGPVFFAAASPYTLGRGAYGLNSSHYNLLSTTEWLLGLPSTGHQDGTSTFPAMKTLFNVTSSTPPPSYAVSGSVTNTTAGPIAGAMVYANGSTTHNSTTASATGAFSFTFGNGTYQVTATAPGYVPASTSVTVSGQAVSGVSLVLSPVPRAPPPTYPVNGSVLDQGTNGSITDSTVFANNSSASVSATSSSTGAFSFELSNGTYTVTAVASGFDSQTETFTVSGQAISGLDLRLAPTAPPPVTYSVSGLVLAYPNATPVAGAEVFANSTAGSIAVAATSNGSYEFHLPNGTYELTASALGYAPLTDGVQVNGTAVLALNLELVPHNLPTYPAAGVVRNTNGSGPVSNATLFFTNGSYTIRVLTNTTGGFLAILPSGTYSVTVVAGGYVSAVTDVAITGPTATNLNFTLLPVAMTRSGSSAGWTVPTVYYLVAAAGIAVACGTGWLLGRYVRRPGRRPPPQSRSRGPV